MLRIGGIISTITEAAILLYLYRHPGNYTYRSLYESFPDSVRREITPDAVKMYVIRNQDLFNICRNDARRKPSVFSLKRNDQLIQRVRDLSDIYSDLASL